MKMLSIIAISQLTHELYSELFYIFSSIFDLGSIQAMYSNHFDIKKNLTVGFLMTALFCFLTWDSPVHRLVLISFVKRLDY